MIANKFNKFNTNSYYPIDSFKYFHDYVEIISNGQKYKSYNKRIKTVLNNYKLIDNKFYCNYLNQKTEAKIGIRTYNKSTFKVFKNNKYISIPYIEQTLEVCINNKKAAYYLNFAIPIKTIPGIYFDQQVFVYPGRDQVFVNILCINDKYYFEDMEKGIYYEIPSLMFHSRIGTYLNDRTDKMFDLKYKEFYCYDFKHCYWEGEDFKYHDLYKEGYVYKFWTDNKNNDSFIKHEKIHELDNYLILGLITPLKEDN